MELFPLDFSVIRQERSLKLQNSNGRFYLANASVLMPLVKICKNQPFKFYDAMM